MKNGTYSTAKPRSAPRNAPALRGEAETLAEVALGLTAEFDLKKLVQKVTDAGTALAGAQFGAFFYNVEDDAGQGYSLYTLTGAARDAFASTGLPRSTPLFESTFRGTEVIRLDDVTRDPRYGRNPPHRGVPEGHVPVKSYLAVPVISRSGEVLGGLLFGHREPAMFTERAERLIKGLAAQAAVAIDNARLYEELRRELDERTATESALRESEQRHRQLIESLPAAVFTCDTETRLTMYNEAAAALWGRTPRLGDPLASGPYRTYRPDGTLMPADDFPVMRVLREGRTVDAQEIVIERPDGTRRNVLSHPRPLYDGSGKLTGAINMLVDITERKQAEEARRRSEEMLRRRDGCGGHRHVDARSRDQGRPLVAAARADLRPRAGHIRRHRGGVVRVRPSGRSAAGRVAHRGSHRRSARVRVRVPVPPRERRMALDGIARTHVRRRFGTGDSPRRNG